MKRTQKLGSLVANGTAEPFERVLERSAATADRLERNFGLRPSDRIAVSLENSREYVELIIAAWRLGLQFIAIPPTTSQATFAGIIDRMSPRATVIDEGNERLNRILGNWAGTIAPLRDSPRHHTAVIGVRRDQAAGRQDRTRRPDRLAPDWPAWLAHTPSSIFFTSGSTSTAKGVPLLWPRILDKALAVFGSYGITSDDRVMPILPLSHVYGLYCLMGAMAIGADCITYRESESPAGLTVGLADHAATAVICPPIVGAFLFGRHGAEPAVRDRLRVLSMGGAATVRSQAERIVAALPHTRIFLSYGLAETYSTICCNEVSLPGSDLGSVGPLRFGAFGDVRDPVSGAPVGGDEIGELCVGGTIMSGYVGIDVDCYTADGLFRTGDFARLGHNGAVTITGRLKEMINAGGLSINPSEIEETLKQHPAVLDCGVFGEQAGDLEVACAAVVLRGAGNECERQRIVDELFDYCRKNLAAKMAPRRIMTVHQIPRGALGKIARAELHSVCASS